MSSLLEHTLFSFILWCYARKTFWFLTRRCFKKLLSWCQWIKVKVHQLLEIGRDWCPDAIACRLFVIFYVGQGQPADYTCPDVVCEISSSAGFRFFKCLITLGNVGQSQSFGDLVTFYILILSNVFKILNLGFYTFQIMTKSRLKGLLF